MFAKMSINSLIDSARQYWMSSITLTKFNKPLQSERYSEKHYKRRLKVSGVREQKRKH
jgi:hypothetical protein